MPWDGMSGTLGRAEERRICKALDFFPPDRTENSSEILDGREFRVGARLQFESSSHQKSVS